MSDSLLSKIYPSAAGSVPVLCDGSLKTAASWPNFTDVSAKWGCGTKMKGPMGDSSSVRSNQLPPWKAMKT